MSTLLASHYAQTHDVLMREPIIAMMGAEIVVDLGADLSALRHDDGTPRFGFMRAAHDEYVRRGGTLPDRCAIGSVARAVLAHADLCASIS